MDLEGKDVIRDKGMSVGGLEKAVADQVGQWMVWRKLLETL